MRAWLALVVGAGLTVGCALRPPQIGAPAPRVSDDALEQRYQDTLGRYTRREEVYAGLDTRMFAAATYQSWPFRQARIQRLAAFESLPPSRVEELLTDERRQHEQFHEFFFAAHVNDPRWDDFDRPDSIWRIALVLGTLEAAPVEISRIGRADLNLRAYYPYLGAFWVAYRVRFSRAEADAQKLLLKVASTLGKVELAFQP